MPLTYQALLTRQRDDGTGPDTAVFVAKPPEIAEIAAVERLRADGGGVQRRRNEAKVRAITRFLANGPGNTLPTSLTLSLRGTSWDPPPTSGGCGKLVVPTLAEGGEGLIIDGQHRLFGALAFDPQIPLNIVAILDADDLEIAFQFLVINNKASKVPTDHVRLLAINYQEKDLELRLATARLALTKTNALVGAVDFENDSPFYQSLIWPLDEIPSDRTPLVRPAAIEVSLVTIEAQQLVGLENEDALLAFFMAMWSAVRVAWPALWVAGSRLLSKAGLVAMTQFLLDDLTPLIDRDKLDASNPDAVSEEVGTILSDLVPDFWTSDWTMTSLDTSAGRQIVVEALQRIRRNRRRGEPWFAGITLVDASATDPIAEVTVDDDPASDHVPDS